MTMLITQLTRLVDNYVLNYRSNGFMHKILYNSFKFIKYVLNHTTGYNV